MTKPHRVGYKMETGSGDTLTVTNPGAPGDLLLAFIAINAIKTITPPAGWTLLEAANGGSAIRIAAYWHVVDDPAADDYEWQVSSSGDAWRVVIVAYRGYTAVQDSDIATANNSTHTAPALTTTAVNTLSVYFFANNDTTEFTTTKQFLDIAEAAPAVAAGQSTKVALGTAGPFQGTLGGSEPGGGIHVTLTPDSTVSSVSAAGYERVLIGNHHGRIIAQINPGLEPVSWRLNDWGNGSFVMPASDPQATEELLEFGNRILIEFNNGLPVWGGVIDTPRDWTPEGTIFNSIYTGEILADWRVTGKGRYFNEVSPAHIFESVIREANVLYPSGILPGSVGGGNSTHFPDYHYDKLLEIIRDSICQRMTDHDFYFRPVIENGHIVFRADLYSRRGRDRRNVALVEGRNIVHMGMTEQGPIVNAWHLAGSNVSGGDGWGDDRLTAYTDDQQSINKYGLREGSEVHSGVVYQETLDRNASNNLQRTRRPERMFDIEVANISPGKFGDYDIGDRMRLLAPSFGFGGVDAVVRLLEREYHPSTGLCRLVVKEWLEDA